MLIATSLVLMLVLLLTAVPFAKPGGSQAA